MLVASPADSLRIRAYNVGFGDCFLLTFRYPTVEKHVLIDFGSAALPPGSLSMNDIAAQIKNDCGGRLLGVVATHRHKDHISGFATGRSGDGPGDVIASCQPKVVIQPWTEDPDVAPDARAPTNRYGRGALTFTGRLAAMQEFAAAAFEFSLAPSFIDRAKANELRFLGENNVTNRSAVKNLIRMGEKGRAVYAHFRSSIGLGSLLPGVAVHVLGPPTIKQSEAIRIQRSAHATEYWHMQAKALHRSSNPAGAPSLEPSFPQAAVFRSIPVPTRWLVDRLQRLVFEDVLELVRVLDEQMNNTSLILLFRVGSQGFLFPGDAQLENWAYALRQPKVKQLLKDVCVYKVGHHGSLNGTPKSLWNLFDKRGPRSKTDRMIALNSTMTGKHGSLADNTEVPRRTLVDALKQNTRYLSTEKTVSPHKGYIDIEVDF